MLNLVDRSELMQLLCKDDAELMKLAIIIPIKFCCNCFFETKFYFSEVYFVLLQFQYFNICNISRYSAAVQMCKVSWKTGLKWVLVLSLFYNYHHVGLSKLSITS